MAAPGWTVGLTTLVLLQSLAGVSQLYLTKRLLDSVVTGLQSKSPGVFDAIVFWIALGAASAWLVAILRSLVQYASEAQAEKVSESVQDMIAAKSIQVDLSYYEDPAYFDTLHQAQLEAPFRPTRIIGALTDIGQAVISLLAMGSILLFSFSPLVFLVLIGLLCVGSLSRFRHVRSLYEWRKQTSGEERELSYFNWLLSSAAAAKEIRVFGLGEAFMRRAATLRSDLRTAKMTISKKRVGGEVVLQGLVSLGMFLAVFHLARRTFLSILSVGDFIMNLQALQRSATFLQQLTGGVSQLYEHGLFLGRLFEFLSLRNKLSEPELPADLPDEIADGIEFRDVCFQYPTAAEPTLHAVSFRIRPGQMVAVVGENGAGKSTLAKLLCRLYEPSSGSILIDGTDLRNFSRGQLWQRMAALFQDFVQYQATVRDNISFDAVHAGIAEETIQCAATRGGAQELIMQLPRQYDQVLGKLFEGGTELSGGEWQKIALSRAFFRNAQIILLDEPTSALDVTAEHDFFERFRRLAKGRMSLVISHRLSTVRMADVIIYLEDGRITEMGSHRELMDLGGAYAALFTKQAGQYR